jgi:hypothetical protein
MGLKVEITAYSCKNSNFFLSAGKKKSRNNPKEFFHTIFPPTY